MARISDERFFSILRAFLTAYMPVHRKMSGRTVRAYKQSIGQFVGYLQEERGMRLGDIGFDCCTRDSVYGFLVWLRDDRGCAPSTLNLRLAAICSFLKYAAETDVSTASFYAQVATIKSFKRERSQTVDHLTEEQVALLLSVPDASTRKGRRDRFFMLLAYETGARLQEMLDLRCGDIDRHGGYARVCIHGKGSKVRYVPLVPAVVEHLDAYMAEFHPDGDANAWLFYTRHAGEPTKMGAGTPDHFLKKYASAAHEADLSFPENLHAHMLRHSIAMTMHRSGIPISYIRDFLGHASVTTTSIYAYAEEDAVREALESLNHDEVQPEKKWKGNEQSLLEYCGLA